MKIKKNIVFLALLTIFLLSMAGVAYAVVGNNVAQTLPNDNGTVDDTTFYHDDTVTYTPSIAPGETADPLTYNGINKSFYWLVGRKISITPIPKTTTAYSSYTWYITPVAQSSSESAYASTTYLNTTNINKYITGADGVLDVNDAGLPTTKNAGDKFELTFNIPGIYDLNITYTLLDSNGVTISTETNELKPYIIFVR